MKTDLDELIAQLESERDWLRQQIADYVDEADYWYASHHQRALEEVNHKIGLLKKFENPDFYEIERLENYIPLYQDHIDKKISKNTNQALRDFYNEKIEEAKRKLDSLRNGKRPALYDEQVIDEALFALVQKSVNGFHIDVDFGEYLYRLNFRLTDDLQFIKIVLTGLFEIEENESDKDGHFDNELTLNRFKKIGFDWINRQLIYHYNIQRFNDAWEIKIMLARLFFEVFYFSPNSVSLIYDK